jgi:cytochrome P450
MNENHSWHNGVAISTDPHEMSDPLAICDRERSTCPVAHHPARGWTLHRHADVLQAAREHRSFSNVVSRHVAIPNGMDPPEHTLYREMIDKYFLDSQVQALEPVFRDLAQKHWLARPEGEVEVMEHFACPLALSAQCSFAGWPGQLASRLAEWLEGQQRAARTGKRELLDQHALAFAALVIEQLEQRRRDDPDLQRQDVTTRLMREKIAGRYLSDDELVSILRNWTVGELATMASAIGILVGFLADRPTLQDRLRQKPEEIPYAIEEILRLQGPLWSNRRVVSRDICLGGQQMRAGEPLTLMWASANRDESVFVQPTTFRRERDLSASLLFGAGIHRCPGASLALLQLRLALETVLSSSTFTAGGRPPIPAQPPAAGWSRIWVTVI